MLLQKMSDETSFHMKCLRVGDIRHPHLEQKAYRRIRSKAVDIGNVVDLCLNAGADNDVFKYGSGKGVACRFDELVSYRACKVECERELDSGCL